MEEITITDVKKIILGLVLLIITGMFGCPQYKVYEQKLEGEAELAKATFNRQVKVRESEATLESATNLANAEIERAKGVSKANSIIGDSLKNNEGYLRYLYISNMEKAEAAGSAVYYIPTEAGLPILEAGKRK